MSSDLASRLSSVAELLDGAERLVGAQASKFQVGEQDAVAAVFRFRKEIPALREAIVARDSAFDALVRMNETVVLTGVDLLGSAVGFSVARLMFVQSYVAANWSIADRITDFVGGVFLPRGDKKGSDSRERGTQAQLLSHFVGGNAESRGVPGLVPVLREVVGWSSAVSYELRNVFVHSGGRVDGHDLLDAPTPAALFGVTQRGWDALMSRLGRHQFKVPCNRRGQAWPGTLADLRVVLRDCESDVDAALGSLVVSASHAIVTNVRYLLEVG